jgi:hypothetical protein
MWGWIGLWLGAVAVVGLVSCTGGAPPSVDLTVPAQAMSRTRWLVHGNTHRARPVGRSGVTTRVPCWR